MLSFSCSNYFTFVTKSDHIKCGLLYLVHKLCQRSAKKHMPDVKNERENDENKEVK